MQSEPRRETMPFLQTVTTVAVIVFALLLVSVERPLRLGGRELLPIGLGVVGLLFVAVALMAMDGFRRQWAEAHPPADASEPDPRALVPLLFEAGLWGLGLLYVVRLAEIARG
jgi:hypothetical protein